MATYQLRKVSHEIWNYDGDEVIGDTPILTDKSHCWKMDVQNKPTFKTLDGHSINMDALPDVEGGVNKVCDRFIFEYTVKTADGEKTCKKNAGPSS